MEGLDEKNRILIVLEEDGTEKQAEILSVFTLHSNGKKYIVYTLNEKDEYNFITLYASRLIEVNGTNSFEVIESDDEWNQVKDVMNQIAVMGEKMVKEGK